MSDPIMERWNNFLIAEGLDERCNHWHDENGHFTSKDKAKTYSISEPATKDCGDDKDKPSRAGKYKVTKNQKLKPQMVLAQCGRIDPKTGKRHARGVKKSCKDYPKGYASQKDEGVSFATGEVVSDERERRLRQPEERKDALFGGYKEISRISRGLVEIARLDDSPVLLMHPASMDAEELSEMAAVLLGEQEQPCPQHCIQQVLDLLARVNRAQKGET